MMTPPPPSRPLRFIEEYLQHEVMLTYGNTHTTTSLTSRQTTYYREEARWAVAWYNLQMSIAIDMPSCSLKFPLWAVYVTACLQLLFLKHVIHIIGMRHACIIIISPCIRSIIRVSLNCTEEDSLIFVGSGCTGAVAKLVSCLCLDKLEQPAVVFVSPFEHHSNLLPWQETKGTEVYCVELGCHYSVWKMSMAINLAACYNVFVVLIYSCMITTACAYTFDLLQSILFMTGWRMALSHTFLFPRFWFL